GVIAASAYPATDGTSSPSAPPAASAARQSSTWCRSSLPAMSRILSPPPSVRRPQTATVSPRWSVRSRLLRLGLVLILGLLDEEGQDDRDDRDARGQEERGARTGGNRIRRGQARGLAGVEGCGVDRDEDRRARSARDLLERVEDRGSVRVEVALE